MHFVRKIHIFFVAGMRHELGQHVCDGFYTILSIQPIRRTRTVLQSNNYQFLHQKMFIFKGTLIKY